MVLFFSAGLKTGRSPADKRIVEEPSSKDDIWWGKVNIPFAERAYLTNRERAVDYLNLQVGLFVHSNLFVFAGFRDELPLVRSWYMYRLHATWCIFVCVCLGLNGCCSGAAVRRRCFCWMG